MRTGAAMTVPVDQLRVDVDANISDLFFNSDLSLAKVHDRDGGFVGYDDEALRCEAKLFLEYLARLTVGGVPSVDDLVADFYERV
jgi:hypothetical protein